MILVHLSSNGSENLCDIQYIYIYIYTFFLVSYNLSFGKLQIRMSKYYFNITIKLLANHFNFYCMGSVI